MKTFKNNAIIGLIIAIILAGIVHADVVCDISTDNETWQNVSSALNDGCIDQTFQVASIQNLQPGTEYFIRCKDDSTDYGYKSFTTLPGGFDETMLSTVLGLIFLVIVFGFIAFFTKEGEEERKKQVIGVRILSLSLAVIETLLLVGVLWLGDAGESITNLLRINFWVLMWLGLGLAMIALTTLIARFFSFDDLDKEDNQDSDKKW